MSQQHIQQRASRVTRFLVVQLIALVGWIIVQSFFSLSLPGRAVPFTVTIVIEAVWWIITLVIMFLLFRREYKSFVQAALDLEDANKRLREATNRVLHELRNQSDQAVYEPAGQAERTEPESPGQAEHEPAGQAERAEQELTDQGDQTGQATPTQDEKAEHEPIEQSEQVQHELTDQTAQARPESANQSNQSNQSSQAAQEAPAQSKQAEPEPLSQSEQAEQSARVE